MFVGFIGLALPSWLPDRQQIEEFTSTREVTAIATAPNGAVAVGTTGGLLWITKDGKISKQPVLSGLPSNQLLGLRNVGDRIIAHFPGDRFCEVTQDSVHPAKPPSNPPKSVTWNGRTWTLVGDCLVSGTLQMGGPAGTAWLTDAVADGPQLFVAAYGKGVFSRSALLGKANNWVPIDTQDTDPTALAITGHKLWVGTHHQGVYSFDEKGHAGYWNPAGELASSCVVSLSECQNRIYAGTLDYGLSVKTSRGWKDVIGPTYEAPRQLVLFQNKLYLRHGNGAIDVMSGYQWQRGFQANLPRPECSALAPTEKALLIGQWGGWSEWNGNHLVSHFEIPQLKNKAITCLTKFDGSTWVGTQGNGLVQVPDLGIPQSFSLASGIKDDWIVGLVRYEDALYFGTYAGGLYRIENGRPVRVSTASSQIRGLASGRRLWIVTAAGLEQIGPAFKLPKRFVPIEPQTVLETDDALWIGCRSGLYRVTSESSKRL